MQGSYPSQSSFRRSQHLMAAQSRKYPYAIVWAPIPLLSWLLPCIGHMGICTSDGTILDFAGPFTVNLDAFLFGRPARFLALEPRSAVALLRQQPEGDVEAGQAKSYSWDMDVPGLAHRWDGHLDACAQTYRQRMYNICTDNCHAFVVIFLNTIAYKGRSAWNMVDAAALVFLRGRYAGLAGCLHTWLPFCVIAVLGSYFGRLYFLYVYLAITAPLLAWFLFYTYVLWKPCRVTGVEALCAELPAARDSTFGPPPPPQPKVDA